jgi:hypothetical protein
MVPAKRKHTSGQCQFTEGEDYLPDYPKRRLDGDSSASSVRLEFKICIPDVCSRNLQIYIRRGNFYALCLRILVRTLPAPNGTIYVALSQVCIRLGRKG